MIGFFQSYYDSYLKGFPQLPHPPLPPLGLGVCERLAPWYRISFKFTNRTSFWQNWNILLCTWVFLQFSQWFNKAKDDLFWQFWPSLQEFLFSTKYLKPKRNKIEDQSSRYMDPKRLMYPELNQILLYKVVSFFCL